MRAVWLRIAALWLVILVVLAGGVPRTRIELRPGDPRLSPALATAHAHATRRDPLSGQPRRHAGGDSLALPATASLPDVVRQAMWGGLAAGPHPHVVTTLTSRSSRGPPLG